MPDCVLTIGDIFVRWMMVIDVEKTLDDSTENEVVITDSDEIHMCYINPKMKHFLGVTTNLR